MAVLLFEFNFAAADSISWISCIQYDLEIVKIVKTFQNKNHTATASYKEQPKTHHSTLNSRFNVSCQNRTGQENIFHQQPYKHSHCAAAATFLIVQSELHQNHLLPLH